jgi:acyl-coenzyme A synthetase/AMP-(fatty) acid ligase
MHDCEAKVLLTASGVMRGNKKIDLKAIADSGLDMCEKQGEWSTLSALVAVVAVPFSLHACKVTAFCPPCCLRV